MMAMMMDARLWGAFSERIGLMRVCGVYRHAVNIEAPVPEGLFTLLACDGERGPYGIISNCVSFSEVGIQAGDMVTLRDDALTIEGRCSVELRGAISYSCKSPAFTSSAALGARAGKMRTLLAGRDPHEADLAARFSRLRTAFVAALLSGGGGTALSVGKGLVGLGPGLTPSGDDWLSALCYVLALAGNPAAALGEELAPLADYARANTTALSYAMLARARRGLGGERLAGFSEAMMTGSGTQPALEALLEVGACSGWSLAAGVADGLWLSDAMARRGVAASDAEERIDAHEL